ncbi:hypothetical protein SY89_03069 [Halolamina pelagica]|uniref:DUF58 domain-containing protein n=1 Tax=Halolamina pelagica TaxID=699431 RepID=A0A0P7I5K3_9EURY|nr:hypothetical protein [Halolamina pelagica]KPN32301.1 hypothetical protein SY89_03069 [Halolamina pelagica]
MRPTPRFLQIGTAGAVLVGVGVLAKSPVAVLGGVALGCWLLVEQYTALRSFAQATERLDVDVSPVRTAAIVDEPLSVTVDATLARPVDTTIEVAIDLPPAPSTGMRLRH